MRRVARCGDAIAWIVSRAVLGALVALILTILASPLIAVMYPGLFE